MLEQSIITLNIHHFTTIFNQMKKTIFYILLMIISIHFSFAHSGRTDSKGGHWNHKTGTYHYHGKKNKSSGGKTLVYSLIAGGLILLISNFDRKK